MGHRFPDPHGKRSTTQGADEEEDGPSEIAVIATGGVRHLRVELFALGVVDRLHEDDVQTRGQQEDRAPRERDDRTPPLTEGDPDDDRPERQRSEDEWDEKVPGGDAEGLRCLNPRLT